MGAGGGTPISFGQSQLAGAGLTHPTALEFGPDGRLYVAQVDGTIKAYAITRTGQNAYAVTRTEKIKLIAQMPNHDDNGALNPGVTKRQVTGILVTGTPTNPVIYVGSSDPRGSFNGGSSVSDTNSGIVSRLTWTGTAWQQLDLVRGLPRSREDHGTNGLALDSATNTLFVAQGGNTNDGAPSKDFAFLPEYAYSGAILKIDLNAIGTTTYDLPTLIDNHLPGLVGPFGGDGGRHQARLDPAGPVQLYATGFRNPYDVMFISAGEMYTIDNGANAGFGGPPIGAGPAGQCTNAANEGGADDSDSVHIVTGPGYYGGHANPTRGNPNNTFDHPPQSPVPSGDPKECNPLDSGHNGSVATLPGSTNGFAEYTASNFGGRLKGSLIAANLYSTLYRIHLSSSGGAVIRVSKLNANLGVSPLDVATQGDSGAFPGTIWVADLVKGAILVLEPSDYSGR